MNPINDAEKNTQNQSENQELFLKGRKTLSLTGVKEVEGFDEENVLLETLCGRMTITGEGLHVSVLDVEKGVVTLQGRVDGLFYETEPSEKKGFFARFSR